MSTIKNTNPRPLLSEVPVTQPTNLNDVQVDLMTVGSVMVAIVSTLVVVGLFSMRRFYSYMQANQALKDAIDGVGERTQNTLSQQAITQAMALKDLKSSIEIEQARMTASLDSVRVEMNTFTKSIDKDLASMKEVSEALRDIIAANRQRVYDLEEYLLKETSFRRRSNTARRLDEL